MENDNRYLSVINVMTSITKAFLLLRNRPIAGLLSRPIAGLDLVVLASAKGWCDICGPRPTAEDILPFVRTCQLDPTITKKQVADRLRRLARMGEIRRFGRSVPSRWTVLVANRKR